MLIYQKNIDRSSLLQGFQIPVNFHSLIKATPGGMPDYGESRNIKILIDGIAYDAQLKNQGFDKKKFEGHADVIQIRYNETSAIAQKLREIFISTWKYVETVKNLPENVGRKKVIWIPESQQETLALTSTDLPNVYLVEYTTVFMKKEVSDCLKSIDELNFETIDFRIDTNASKTREFRVQTIRHLDRSIGESLKRLYDYRCQMTGERIGEAQGALCVEAHHIQPFTESLNNDYSNIIIISPSYHRIIHKARPVFDRSKLTFTYPNGLVDKVLVDRHLNVR